MKVVLVIFFVEFVGVVVIVALSEGCASVVVVVECCDDCVFCSG